jgi:protein-S-isoprenylcysteine O-methyltransferase Ste14
MQGSQLRILTGLQIVGVGLLFWLLVAWPGRWDFKRYVGTLLAGMGIVFIWVARYQLGKSFSIRPEARELVTTGIYSKIRNPIYVFGSVTLAGLSLVLEKPVLWLLLGALIIVQTARAHKEAQVLEKSFGDTYREYRRKTWF